ncbi:hypothetical protein DID88_004136 [Monilinia fructigena]|uniref:Skg3/CAF120-like PH-like domain-containing protein n=1 Tax=Monilinia fructigena TaxID=38457 RepID=A0A395ISB4_9HELO|nr:hypothetical protein DID88_004136 [Monilinia fructigena]
MGRNRVMSFMSQFRDRDSSGPTRTPLSSGRARSRTESYTKPESQEKGKSQDIGKEPFPTSSFQMPSHQEYPSSEARDSPQPIRTRERASSRPMPMATPQPPLMDSQQQVIHGRILFEIDDDQNINGKANADRTWTECFAQLDRMEKSFQNFINLTDASIKMIESLPTRSPTEAPLQNVLSVSTAGKNRYLLHFNSHHSLVQWTAGIRLSMYEHVTLQEAYTGALIAGKGKLLNNIKPIMERSKIQTADWAREFQRVQKQSQKKRSAYDRSRPPILKGDIKFYDSKKTRKVRPIATITDAYSAFAIYPQSKPLIDSSTLVKVEGSITIHSNPPLASEGFVFVMPEVHPAVSGFEMMLRWLFPVYDTFGLYGRPGRLIAETNDTRSLMFAMPEHRRYGYLETLDVSRITAKEIASLVAEEVATVWAIPELASGLTTHRQLDHHNPFSLVRVPLHFNNQSLQGRPTTGQYQRPNRQAVQRIKSPSVFDGAYNQAPAPFLDTLGDPISRDGSGMKHAQDVTDSPERLSSEDEQAANVTPVRELQDLQTVTIPEPVAAPPAFKHAPGAKPPSKPLQSPDLRKANNRMSTATLSQLTGAAGAAGAAASYHQGQERRGMNAQKHDRIEEDEDQGRGAW